MAPATSAFGSAEYSLNRSSSARNDASISFVRSGLEAPLVGDGIGTSCRAQHRLHLDERHENDEDESETFICSPGVRISGTSRSSRLENMYRFT